MPGQRGAIALDYDYESGYIFWTDVINETINRAKMEENPKVDVLVKIDLDTPDGIAVDWVNKKLYWTDTGTDMIEVSDFNGTNRLELITTGLEEPRAIVVHPALGYVKVICSCFVFNAPTPHLSLKKHMHLPCFFFKFCFAAICFGLTGVKHPRLRSVE